MAIALAGAMLAACDQQLAAPPVPTLAIPSITPAPSATPLPSPTLTPSSTPRPTHPLMIELMRQQAYPGSDLVVEEILWPGANYHRMIVSYQSEGYKIYALLTIPQGEKPPTGWPVIVFNHGFIPPDEYSPTERYVAYVDSIARHGYMVLRPDYRGHGDSEGPSSGAYGSPGYTVDVLNAVASIKRHPDSDPNRIGMWGHSMGGHIALRAMVISKDIRAGSIWGGVVGSYPELIEHWWNPRQANSPRPSDPTFSRGRWRQKMIAQFGSPEENPEFWASISPTTYLADISGPLQLHHSTTDETVPAILSQLLYSRMLVEGIPAILYLYEGDDHDITANFSLAMERTIQFFDETVKGP